MPPRGLAVDQFGGKGRTGMCRTAADRLALRFLDHLRPGIDPHLELHHIDSRDGQADAPIWVILRLAADVARA